jgi:hexosaminidase
MELFPSEYIHIGGDECPKVSWEACPKCQAKIRQLGLKDEGKNSAEHYLQNYVMSRMEKYLNDNGRKMIGWDEILEGSATKTSTVMVWRDQQHAVTAVRRGNDVIITLRHNCYFDYCQTSDPESEPLCVTHRYLSMRQAYRLDPYERMMTTEYDHVLGVQANLWTEYIADFQQVQHMLLPRLAALSETAWAYDRKDTYEVFAERAKGILPQWYDSYGLNYSPYFFDGIE